MAGPSDEAIKEYTKALKLKDLEINNLKEKLTLLEMESAQAQKIKAQRNKENLEIQALKAQSENILTKAKTMIFENTKIIKNQELQIEALIQQNDSLKDVVKITKDLLEIRNMEVKQLEEQMTDLKNKMKVDRERQANVHSKLEKMIRHNGELKREYEAQLCLFNALRQRYNERELAEGVLNEARKDLAEAKAEQGQNNTEKANENVQKEDAAEVQANANGVQQTDNKVTENLNNENENTANGQENHIEQATINNNEEVKEDKEKEKEKSDEEPRAPKS